VGEVLKDILEEVDAVVPDVRNRGLLEDTDKVS